MPGGCTSTCKAVQPLCLPKDNKMVDTRVVSSSNMEINSKANILASNNKVNRAVNNKMAIMTKLRSLL